MLLLFLLHIPLANNGLDIPQLILVAKRGGQENCGAGCGVSPSELQDHAGRVVANQVVPTALGLLHFHLEELAVQSRYIDGAVDDAPERIDVEDITGAFVADEVDTVGNLVHHCAMELRGKEVVEEMNV